MSRLQLYSSYFELGTHAILLRYYRDTVTLQSRYNRVTILENRTNCVPFSLKKSYALQKTYAFIKSYALHKTSHQKKTLEPLL